MKLVELVLNIEVNAESVNKPFVGFIIGLH